MTNTNPDCAANGGPTISRVKGCINDEMRECIVCRNQCRWDMTEHSFFGFAADCPVIREDMEPTTPRKL